jgi:hypothetical protein
MAHYHIELRAADQVWETLDIERDDLDALRLEIARFVGELLKEHAQQIWRDRDWRIDVTSEDGMILYVLHLFATESPAMGAPQRPSGPGL